MQTPVRARRPIWSSSPVDPPASNPPATKIQTAATTDPPALGIRIAAGSAFSSSASPSVTAQAPTPPSCLASSEPPPSPAGYFLSLLGGPQVSTAILPVLVFQEPSRPEPGSWLSLRGGVDSNSTIPPAVPVRVLSTELPRSLQDGSWYYKVQPGSTVLIPSYPVPVLASQEPPKLDTGWVLSLRGGVDSQSLTPGGRLPFFVFRREADPETGRTLFSTPSGAQPPGFPVRSFLIRTQDLVQEGLVLSLIQKGFQAAPVPYTATRVLFASQEPPLWLLDKYLVPRVTLEPAATSAYLPAFTFFSVPERGTIFFIPERPESAPRT